MTQGYKPYSKDQIMPGDIWKSLSNGKQIRISWLDDHCVEYTHVPFLDAIGQMAELDLRTKYTKQSIKV